MFGYSSRARVLLEHVGAVLDARASRLSVGLGPISPRPPDHMLARIIASTKRGSANQQRLDHIYHSSGEWAEIVGENDAFSRDVDDIARGLHTMFRERGHLVIGWAHSSRLLDKKASPRGVLKRALILDAMQHDLAVWRAVTERRDDVSQLAAPDIGSPWGATVDGFLLYPGVFRAHYFAQHISRLLDLIETPGTVVEIGPGYGELAYRLMESRPQVRYICFDLPEVLMKSSYFLMSAFPDKRILLYDDDLPLTQERLEDYDIVLMPNFRIRDLAAMTADVVVNTNSLSEMGESTIADYMQHIGRICRYFFVHQNSVEPIKTHGHIEIPATQFPIPAAFRKVFSQKAPWFAASRQASRYVEFLYARRGVVLP